MQRRVLGKGLDALIPKKTTEAAPKEFTHLALDLITPAKNQPRQQMSKKELEELAASIKEKGLIQPIIVRKSSGVMFEIVAGERRYHACKYLGLKEIPSMIKELSDQEAFTWAIVENLQRKDLNPIEEAEAFRRLLDDFKFSLEQIAKFVSKDKTTVANSLRLLKLPSSIRQALREGLISRSQARTILGIERLQEQEKIFKQILKGGLSVRDIEKKARLVSRRQKKTDPFIVEVEGKLEKSLGTKIKIFNKKNNRGRIVIEYFTLKDLERIIRRIK